MPWQLAIALSLFANSAKNILQRHYSLKSKAPPSFPPAIAYLVGVMPISIVVGLSLSHHIDWSWSLGLLLLGNSSLIAVANWLAFRVSRTLPVAQFQMINQFYEIVAIAFGWSFLHEGLTLFQVIGALLLFVAAILAIRAPLKNLQQSHRKLHFEAVVITLVSATAFGTSLVFEKAALRHVDPGAYMIFGFGAQTLAMLILALKDVNKRTIRAFGKQELKLSSLMGLMNGTGGILYIIAIVNSDNLSLVTAITAIGLPLTAFVAYVYLKERDDQRMLWLGLGLGTIGILISTIH